MVLMTLILSCSEEVAPPTDNFVVEGFLTANMAIDNIKVKQTSPIGSDTITTAPIENANVVLINESNRFMLDFNPSTGLYGYDGDDLEVEVGDEFSLEVQVADRLATATTIVPVKPTNLRLTEDKVVIPRLAVSFALREQITDLFFEARIGLNWDASPGKKYFVVIESRASDVDAILPDVVPDESKELLSSFRFISEPSETPTFEIVGIALDTYGTHVAKVFTVNDEYADLFNSVTQDSRDLNEPPSNVLNALGVFTAFASDSIFFEVSRN